MSRIAFALAVGFFALPARSADPVAPDTQVVAGVLRDLLVKNLPKPALESKSHWGEQKEVTTGVTFKRLGALYWEAVPQKGMRNDGHWQVFKGTVDKPEQTFKLAITDLKTGEPGKTTFKANLAADVAFDYEQQIWKSGARLYSGETRGTCKMGAALACEATSRLEPVPGNLVPALVVRFKVTAADLSYSDLAVDHTLGVGGDAAKVLGEAAIKFAKAVKPSLEKDLLAKANAAVVKAADTKEVRIELDKLLSGKSPVAKGK